jgi:hypothetical protein
MGLLPLGFAILGGIVCWRVWQARLFIIMGLGSLFISFGREGFLYWVLYQLPTMKSQRNPHRWTFFVAFAVCVLAAYGIDWLIRKLKETESKNSDAGSEYWWRWKKILAITTLVGVVFCIVGGFLSLQHTSIANMKYGKELISSNQGPLYVERTRLFLLALFRTGCFLSLSAASVFWLINASNQRRKWGVSLAIMIAVLVVDLGENAWRYVDPYKWEDIFLKSELVKIVSKDASSHRVKVIDTQGQGMLRLLANDVLPYHNLSQVDLPSMSRLSDDYSKFLTYLKDHYVQNERLFEYFNVKYVLAAGMLPSDSLKLRHLNEWNGLHLHERSEFVPRVRLVKSVKVVQGEHDTVLFTLLHPSFNFRDTVVLETQPTMTFTPPPPPSLLTPAVPSAPSPTSATPSKADSKKKSKPSAKTSPPTETPETAATDAKNVEPPSTLKAQEVQVRTYEPQRIEVETVASTPSVLVLSEKWDPDWKAWMDGKPVPILKANFMMRGIEVPAGTHSIRLEYRPSMWGFWISAISTLLFAIGSIVVWTWNRRLQVTPAKSSR